MTLCLYERYQTQTKKFFYFLSLLAFTIALLFKPSVVILPMLILLIDYFIHIKKPNLTSLIPFLALSFFSSLITLYSQKQEGALKALHDISFSDRFTVSSMAYLSYLEKTFYPHALSVFYPLTLYPFYWGVLASLALISITLTGFFLRKKVPAFLFSWIWFVVAIFPVCGLFQVGGQAMADRWTYWPHVGIILGLGLYLHQSHFFKKYQQHILTGLVGLLLLLSYQTHLNMMYWKNSETLFTHALEVTQNNFLAHTNLGVALGQNGNQVAAQAHYEAALRIDPHYTEAINNLGGIYARQGNLTAAIPLFLEALEHNPADREARYNLGLAYYQTGQKIKALSTWLHLAIENPDYQPTWGSLSFVAQHDFASICEFKNQTPENIREDLDLMKHWLELWIPKANIPNLNESIKTLKQCIFK
ncbi:MAG: tetratricopeptide repeat protein [Deltaproteobacteria bacterium]|nr:MAG: tetratricopeptide repeat protein [Deltaproteobacteria bacterium]